jgi:hypothetical protein
MAAYNVTGNNECSGDTGSCTEINALHPCTKENSFGYKDGTPCVFMKLSKSHDWVARLYNSSNLPKKMPVELKNHIETLASEDKNLTVWFWWNF